MTHDSITAPACRLVLQGTLTLGWARRGNATFGSICGGQIKQDAVKNFLDFYIFQTHIIESNDVHILRGSNVNSIAVLVIDVQ